MSLAEQAKKRGDSLCADAQKKLGGFSLFGFGGSKAEAASELYSQAGAQYKIARAWNDAARAYLEYAKLSLNKLSCRSDGAQGLSEAGRAYRNDNNFDKAIECLQQAATIMMEDNRFSPSAKLWVEIAEINVSNMNPLRAVEAYNQASDCYKASNSKVTSQSMQLKAADLLALDGQLDKALKIYEEVADGQAENSSVAYSAAGNYYKSLLCHMVLESNTGAQALTDTEQKLNRYSDTLPRFADGKEATLMRGLLEAYCNGDADAFTQALAKYNSIYTLDQWSSELLYKVKKNLTGEGRTEDAKQKDIDDVEAQLA